MIASHIHHALAQVRELKLRVLESQRFKGYSGRWRAVGGSLALFAPVVMTANGYPKTPTAHLTGWALVAGIAILANYAPVLHWFLLQQDEKRDVRKLLPAVDAMPSLIVCGFLTIALVINRQYDLLFGTWMCLYGLTNMSARQTLPKALWPLGFIYMTCGVICLLSPWGSFINPWPMGIVFGLGEWAGGFIFHRNRMPDATMLSFLNSGGKSHE